jgi:hypothetical protein
MRKCACIKDICVYVSIIIDSEIDF